MIVKHTEGHYREYGEEVVAITLKLNKEEEIGHNKGKVNG
jgi:hypothetical protein|tara:strand:+ start:2985 stop:3104 length:120 start_codon:yes stop_codon:yes gene_type:complete